MFHFDLTRIVYWVLCVLVVKNRNRERVLELKGGCSVAALQRDKWSVITLRSLVSSRAAWSSAIGHLNIVKSTEQSKAIQWNVFSSLPSKVVALWIWGSPQGTATAEDWTDHSLSLPLILNPKQICVRHLWQMIENIFWSLLPVNKRLINTASSVHWNKFSLSTAERWKVTYLHPPPPPPTPPHRSAKNLKLKNCFVSADLALAVLTLCQNSAREHTAVIGWKGSWIPSWSWSCSRAEALPSNRRVKWFNKYGNHDIPLPIYTPLPPHHPAYRTTLPTDRPTSRPTHRPTTWSENSHPAHPYLPCWCAALFP